MKQDKTLKLHYMIEWYLEYLKVFSNSEVKK